MHLLMSFVGSVSVLMAGSGLEEILKSTFGGVQHMLTGMKFPQNTRALRMLSEGILHGIVENIDDHDDLMVLLKTKLLVVEQLNYGWKTSSNQSLL